MLMIWMFIEAVYIYWLGETCTEHLNIAQNIIISESLLNEDIVLVNRTGNVYCSLAPLMQTIHCRMGTIVVELYWRHAPKTCKNFAELARRGYYNNTKFHRVIKEFMVQGGDPTGTGGLITWTYNMNKGPHTFMFFWYVFIWFGLVTDGGKFNMVNLHILPTLSWYKDGYKLAKYPIKYFTWINIGVSFYHWIKLGLFLWITAGGPCAGGIAQ